jgi:hypothetical protein
MLKKAAKDKPLNCPLFSGTWGALLPGKTNIIKIAGQEHQENQVAQGVTQVPCTQAACAWWNAADKECIVLTIADFLASMASDEDDEGGWGKEQTPEGGDGNGGEGRIIELPVNQGQPAGSPASGEGGSPAGV